MRKGRSHKAERSIENLFIEKNPSSITSNNIRMCAYIVADASVFILGNKIEGELVTVPGVVGELRDIASRARFEIFGAVVKVPSRSMVKKAQLAARETGDISHLSETDLELLALSMEMGIALATDDYAIQNVAAHLEIRIEPVGQPTITRKLKRINRCAGCGKIFDEMICPVCGTTRKKRG